MSEDLKKRMPLTFAALGDPDNPEDQPPPIIREWESVVSEHDQNSMLAWVGEWNRGEKKFGWSWTWWNIGETSQNPVSTPAEKIERMLAPIAQAGRIALMQSMYDGAKSPAQLTESTGLKGGNLYYHLRELIYSAYVKELDGTYDLTDLGAQLLATMSGIAGLVVQDKGEEGLMVASSR